MNGIIARESSRKLSSLGVGQTAQSILHPVIWANPPNDGATFIEQDPVDGRTTVIRHETSDQVSV